MARQGAVYDDEKSKNDLDELENKYAAQSADDSDLPEGHPSRSDSLKKREEDTDSVETKADRGERSFYKAEDNDDDSSDDAGSHKFSLRGRLNKRNGTIISAILLLGTGGVLLNSILSGPLQLLQLGKIIELAHFSDNNEFSNNRSARRMYNLLKGKPQNSNLGRVNNVIADRLEIKLNNRSGLKSTYHPTTGRFVGFEVLDEVKARDRIADLTSEKPDVLTERNGKKFINLEGLNFRERRAAIRTFVRGADIDGVAGRLSSRLLIKRAGVDFHPLKGIRRKATDKLVQFYADRKKERVERVREGTADVDINAPNSDKPTDANGDPIPNPDGDEAANAAREIIGDADVDLDSPEAIKSLKTKLLAKLGGAAAAVGAACTLRGLGEEAEKLQYAQTILPMVRTGMMYASVASQIQAGDVNLDELGALQAELFDESDDGDDTTKPSSVFSAQPFQAFRGEELNGPDISPHLKPGKIDEKPFFFRLIDGIPGIDEACSVSDFISGIPVIKQIGQLTGAVIGTFIPIDKFVDGIIGWLAGKGMDYYANGGPLGAIIMYGARLGANNQAAATGGLEISGTESAALRLYNQDSVNYDFNRQGRVAKIFDAEDPRSVVAQLAMARPRTPADMLAAIISSPLKIVSSLMPSAHAATPYDYGFNQVGFSVEEMNDPAISDPYLNAEEVEPQLPALNEKYGKKCFNMTVEAVGESVRVINGDATFNPGAPDTKVAIQDCNSSTDPMLLKYRAYLADAIGTQAEACWEGVDEAACDELGFGAITTGSTTQTPATPLNAPGLNGYAIPCAGLPDQARVTGALPDSVNWTGIKDSGTIGTNSGGQPMKVYIREACAATNVKTIVIASSIHATENYGQGISYELLFKKSLPQNLRIIAIPEINGSHLGPGLVGRVNSNGVNLNRNYNYRWNEMFGDDVNPATTDYRGPSPDSEPETKAVEAFLLAIPDITLLVAYHDNINWVGASGNTDASLAVAYQAYVNSFGLGLGLGNAGGVNIRQKGSLDGWFNEKTGKPALLVELPASVTLGGLGIHADAITNLFTTGKL